MRPPFLLFLKDSREVELYPTLERLESDIETPDVLDGLYEAFDSEGLRLRLIVDEYGLPRARAETSDVEAVRKLILEYYAPYNKDFDASMDLETLVHLLKRIYSYRE